MAFTEFREVSNLLRCDVLYLFTSVIALCGSHAITTRYKELSELTCHTQLFRNSDDGQEERLLDKSLMCQLVDCQLAG